MRRRLGIAVAGALVVAAGLTVHWTLQTRLGDFTADALYAVLVYLLACFVLPRLRPAAAAGIALAFCAGVEFLQLTGAPAAWGAAFPPALLVLGSTFAVPDLAAYALGTAAAGLCDAAAGRIAGGIRTRQAPAMDGTRPSP